MMSVVNNKSKLSALLIASLISVNFVCASETYKNNVVDVRVNKESSDAVKVIIYTDRPYTEPVVVNKKANNKYVILMPETKSTLKSAPTVTNGTGTISNVSVNTQSVAGGKGYTKIIITSEKTITVVPRTQQLVSSSRQLKQVTQQKPVTKVQPKQEPKKTVKPVVAANPVQQVQKPVQQVKKPVQQVKKPSEEAKPKQVSSPDLKQPIEILEQEIKTGQYANIPPDKNDEVLNKEITNNLALEPKKEQTVAANNTSVIENIKSVIKNYQNICLWKLLLLAGAVTFPIIVIMLILTLDKKINKKIDKSFKKEEENYVDYVPSEPEYTDDSYSKPVTQYSSFDEMLDKVDETEPYQDATPIVETSVFNNDFEAEDFNSEPVQNVVEPVIEDAEIPEVPDTDLVREVEEPQIQEEIQPPAEPYNPDGYLSDFGNINDKEFFDELIMQTMAENNNDGLPQESPADEIFKYIDSDSKEDEVQNIEKVKEEEFYNPVQEFINETAETKPENNEPDVQVYTDGDDELTMLTEVKLNDSTGIYLVNYDNFSSLVGHIDDNYFVIKKFDEIVNGRIFLKETEKLKNSKRYLVRVGKNKMVVEVSDTSMDRLLDL